MNIEPIPGKNLASPRHVFYYFIIFYKQLYTDFFLRKNTCTDIWRSKKYIKK